jgi:hypothetical protein
MGLDLLWVSKQREDGEWGKGWWEAWGYLRLSRFALPPPPAKGCVLSLLGDVFSSQHQHQGGAGCGQRTVAGWPPSLRVNLLKCPPAALA